MKRLIVFLLPFLLPLVACVTPTATVVPSATATPVATTCAATVMATDTATPVATATVTRLPTYTPAPTYTQYVTSTRLPTLPLPTLDASATAPGLYFISTFVPDGVGWGWVAERVCDLPFARWQTVQALNWQHDGQLHPGTQTIACPLNGG